MLNNITNFFSLIAGRRIKKTLEPTDIIAVGTKQSKALGDYKPTAIQFSDLQAQLSGGGGNATVEILYADLLVLQQAGTLSPGATYHITDEDIWVSAFNESEINLNAIRKQRVLESTVYDNYDVFNAYETSPSIGDRVYWGCKLWENVNGNLGIALNDSELNSEWTLVPLSDNTVYVDKYYRVDYDFLEDFIIKQYDARGNIITNIFVNYTDIQSVNITDWECEKIKNNDCHGIFNNLYYYGVIYNTNKGIIAGNWCDDDTIEFNSNNGDIYNNYCYTINNNTNLGEISNNYCDYIEYNSNLYSITDNICGDIEYNSNSGYITANGTTLISNCDIKQNNNLGDIINNKVTSTITNNSNLSSISTNECQTIKNNSNNGAIANNKPTVTQINNNSNNGAIDRCANTGSITYNRNNGRIYGLTFTTVTDITNNINNGEISINVVGPITDTVVNK